MYQTLKEYQTTWDYIVEIYYEATNDKLGTAGFNKDMVDTNLKEYTNHVKEVWANNHGYANEGLSADLHDAKTGEWLL